MNLAQYIDYYEDIVESIEAIYSYSWRSKKNTLPCLWLLVYAGLFGVTLKKPDTIEAESVECGRLLSCYS